MRCPGLWSIIGHKPYVFSDSYRLVIWSFALYMASTKMTYKILCVSPDGISESFIEAYQFTIGRSEKAELHIPLSGVSRIHLIVMAKDGDVYIRDNNSSFGTHIGGKAIAKGKFTRYSQGAPIRLGKAPVIISLRMITQIETAQLLAKKNKAYANRLVKHDAVEDINSFISSLLQPKGLFSSISRVNLMNWEHNIKKEMQVFISEMQELANATLEKAKLKGERIIHDANSVGFGIKAKAKEEGAQFLDEVNRKGLELIEQSTQAADSIKQEAFVQKDKLISSAELNSQKMLREAKERFEKISNEADTLDKTYRRSRT